ncbi:Alstrom syndrome protein 1 [Papilio xuthus]|uniref:Alstrom syndrome protein 1 n=1 Tax=Papilio xuthus TaxID=66420 RepID=A0A194PZX2_PAPXU|nr:Alstrom syndrome protein 1 [Papilio xuthus]
MEENVTDNDNEVFVNATIDGDSRSAVNSLILDYYQKFGKKRDLEQFFSLSTADNDIRDPSSLFWRKMKMQSDSSDSGEGKAGTSTELCRISIKCSVPEHSSSPDDTPKSKDDSTSPPIIIEEATSPLQTDHHSPPHSDNESVKSDDNNSQKSIDPQLETSVNKPFSPTSSITSQRKLEWDSLGDVGYGNESDRKTSGSGLSTLERLALHQQYSNNDPMNDTKYGLPTSQSTPLESNIPHKSKKGNVKKTTKIYKKDVDFVEVKVPNTSESTGSINVNLTKHISFNVDKDGDVTVQTSKDNDLPEKISVVTEMTPQVRIDKEIQTTLPHNSTKKTISLSENQQNEHINARRLPILLSLNTLRKKKRRKKLTIYRKKINNRSKKKSNSANLHEKNGEQISAAESFEYMPGHIYNQNQVNNSNKNSNSVGNKSSLESSVGFTTDSSKTSKNSFTRDLEKSINLLKEALQSKYNNTNIKEKLIKEVVQRLIKSQYSDDDSGTVFLSGLSFNSKHLGLQKRSNNTTSSTSDGNEIDGKHLKKPKKSILRVDKFNPSGMASTSQSTPNLCTLTQTEKSINVIKTPTFSNTDSELSSRERNSTDTIPKMSSEDLYNKYLDALKREQVHKKLLKNKETLLKKKLVRSDTCIKAMSEPHDKSYDRLYKLVKDLAQNNVGDGSGDATKIDIGSNSIDQKNNIKSQRNHSVFTLSSGKTVRQSKHVKKYQRDIRDAPEAGCSRINNNNCCNSQHFHNTNCGCKKYENEKISDRDTYYGSHKDDKNNLTSTKQSTRSTDTVVTQNKADVQYVCLCAKEAMDTQDVPDKLLIYKCSRLGGPQKLGLDVLSKASSSVGIQCSTDCVCPKKLKNTTTTTNSLDQSNNNTGLHIIQSSTTVINSARKASNSSQTYSNIDVLLRSQFSDTTNTCTEKRASEYMKHKNLPPYKQGGHKNAKLLPITRATQTEISIDPKISDPTLSDVRFMSDFEFVKVDKQERGGSETKSIPKTFCYNTKHIENDEETFHSIYGSQTETMDDRNEMGTVKSSEDIYTNTERNHDCDKPNLGDTKYNEDKISIPIKGTNMTLVVSLGANTPNIDRTNIGTKENSLSNNQNKISTKKTSMEEDSRGVQCTSTDIFTQMSNETQCFKERDMCLRNQPNPSTCANDIKKLTYDKVCPVNKCVNENSTKYSTYPTKSQNVKKPFVRANTDTHSIQSFVTNIQMNKKVDVETQKDLNCDVQQKATTEFAKPKTSNENDAYKSCKSNLVSEQNFTKKSSNESKSDVEHGASKDPILNMIQDITKRYTKKDMEKGQRKKCFKEIITVLNYLLDTDESSSVDPKKSCLSSSNTDGASTVDQMQRQNDSEFTIKKSYVDKGVQMSIKKNKKEKSCTESSDFPTSSEMPTTSTDSAACKVLHKIKKECERYHHKRCSSHSTQKKRDEYSSTTVNCENCNREHYCSCRSKCKSHKPRSSVDKVKKKAVAYNLIIQTSDSVASEETMCDEGCRPIKNVIVKVPSKFKGSNAPFQEVASKIEKNLPQCSRFENKIHRSKSLPIDSEMSSEDFSKKIRTCTVRDYLEMNRPDFIDKTTRRQDCLKIINQTRSNERSASRKLLSQQLERQQTISALSGDDLQHFARQLSSQLRRKNVAPKFINEREMKKHSEKIYKSLPEVVQKKEDLKKDNNKKTNLLMANIFKKNLQKKVLRGSINLSNYSTVVKI